MATVKKKTARKKTTAATRRKQAATKKKATDKRKALTNKMRATSALPEKPSGPPTQRREGSLNSPRLRPRPKLPYSRINYPQP